MWKPKCCQSPISSEIGKLKFDKNIVIQYESKEMVDGVVGQSQIITTNVLTVFADIKTKTTANFFNGINQGNTTTHIFTIRYTPAIYTQLQELTQEYWILYNGKRYHIVNLENINEENLLIRFNAKVRGKDSVEFSKTR
jgi:SPP1 family predicted phage head-tail adaptor